MTSWRQFEANRRNALKSTGPRTEAGKQMSRRNAVRHGLTAETVISALEDAEDYQGFEAAITAEYDAQSAVERELILRLASLLWRLRRATTMETGLFEIQAQSRQLVPGSHEVLQALFRRGPAGDTISTQNTGNAIDAVPSSRSRARAHNIEFARCFCLLANMPNFALDRLSRYETNLWRQVGRILYTLEMLDHRKPQERTRGLWLGSESQIDRE